MEELLEYWKRFSNVPVNNNDEIEESFLHFDIGTDRIDVWQWFEAQHSDFNISKLLSGEI
ncbi:hypothetical protein pEaSNUABM47_00022 [Erwinia phage pEa_SNUABM_47]|uniref:Uncharacterized protein n=1 Tax=Erwinia phage pEa_SNUABM_47 TaxID=2768774 RepID=A0A7L8ZM09_9CAUD|nr:hypothetical protein pEaSNUABM47_00022 [Erwinia phage pEa_SNUABM_47]